MLTASGHHLADNLLAVRQYAGTVMSALPAAKLSHVRVTKVLASLPITGGASKWGAEEAFLHLIRRIPTNEPGFPWLKVTSDRSFDHSEAFS